MSMVGVWCAVIMGGGRVMRRMLRIRMGVTWVMLCMFLPKVYSVS